MNLRAIHPTEQFILTAIILGLYLLIGGFILSDYLLWDSQWLLALALVPLVTQVQSQKSVPVSALLIAIGLAILSYHLHNSTLYFMALVTAAWCGIQAVLGRLSLLPLLLLMVASPIFKYIVNILSFPLRMQLTNWAVAILQRLGSEAEAAGNIILIKGDEFAVDPACAGLSMLSLALLLGIFILAHLQRVEKKVWPLWLIGLLLTVMLLLNLVSNLLRILLLVWFKILPDNPLHDVLGLLCLFFYALLPFYFLAKQLQHVSFEPATPKPAASAISLRGGLSINYFLLLSLTGVGVSINKQKPLVASEQQVTQLPGFDMEKLQQGVTKYSNEEMLVYLKPVQAFYSTEHHPLICWEGSGYKFRHVQQRQIGADTVYVGELQKGADTLYTAWWMDNGQHQTINQWDWRLRMLKGEEKFKLVNVTVAQKEALPQAIRSFKKQTNYLVVHVDSDRIP